MKIKLLLLCSILFVGCASYQIEEGQPHAFLIVEAPSLEEKRVLTDDLLIVRMYDQSSNKEIGFFRVSAKENTLNFKIPIIESMRLSNEMTFSNLGVVRYCKSEVQLEPKEQASYNLSVKVDSGQCSSRLTDSNQKELAAGYGVMKGNVYKVNLQ